MACGCKKNKTVGTQTTSQSTTNINTTVATPTQTLKLTEAQQQEVDKIIDKINKIN